MNREILFKAKRKDNGEWDYGCLFKNSRGNCYILSESLETADMDMIEVIPETVCQYTGVNDKNDKKLFEGDIIEFEDVGEDGYEYKEGFLFKNQAILVYEDNRFTLSKFLEDENSGYANDELSVLNELLIKENSLEIIGSIYDKEELK